VFGKIGNWFKDMVEWMGDMWDKMWGRGKGKPDSGPRNSVNWMDVMRGMSLILLVVVASAAAILLWRVWRTRPKKLAVVARPVAIVPDLREEGVMADQLPTDEWLKLAAEMMEKGEYRLAMRAFYLSGLSHLGKQGLISIARYKSNYEYRIELERRARAKADLLSAFAENVLVFDRAWYGLHEVTPESIRQFRSNLDRIRAC
ncbi:MAG TPA: hypothetical protein VK968_11860, partial [Roseimicrobium sp.]|nr:hypothetical protein [Roseimicrobium sp.]